MRSKVTRHDDGCTIWIRARRRWHVVIGFTLLLVTQSGMLVATLYGALSTGFTEISAPLLFLIWLPTWMLFTGFTIKWAHDEMWAHKTLRLHRETLEVRDAAVLFETPRVYPRARVDNLRFYRRVLFPKSHPLVKHVTGICFDHGGGTERFAEWLPGTDLRRIYQELKHHLGEDRINRQIITESDTPGVEVPPRRW